MQIESLPERPIDPKYFIVVTTVATNGRKPTMWRTRRTRSAGPRACCLVKVESLDGVPEPLQIWLATP